MLPEFIDVSTADKVLIDASAMNWSKAYLGFYRDDALVDKRLNLEERDVEVARLNDKFESYAPGFSLRLRAVVADLYGLADTVVDGFVMSRYTAGSHIRPHSDTGIRSTSRLVTAVQYFDSGYTGGVLGFPQFGLDYPPNARDLVLFFSEYLHSVSQITSGSRHSMICFAKTQAMLRLPTWR